MIPTRRAFLKQLAAGAALAGLSSLTSEPVRAQDEAPKNLIIFAWDGAGLSNVGPMLARGQLPNLKKLMQTRGARLAPLQLIARTCTLPSFPQIFTGLTYDQTSIIGNFYHDLETDMVQMPRESTVYSPRFSEKVSTWMGYSVWYGAIPHEHSVIKPIKELGYSTGMCVSKSILANVTGGPFENIAGQADLCQYVEPIIDHTVPLREMELDDTYLNRLSEGALDFLAGHERYFLFLHLNPDVYGHRYGEANKRYRHEFVRCDTVLGKILRMTSPDATNIVVMADHGFDPNGYSHSNAPDAWMVSDLPIHDVFVQQEGQKAFGTMRDVTHTILDHFNIPLDFTPMQMRGVSLLT